MWPRRSHILYPLTEAPSVPKGRKILWNDELERSFKELKRTVSTDMLLIYLDRKLPFTVHTDAYDKQLCAVTSQKNRLIDFFSIILGKQHCNYTLTLKKLLMFHSI